MIPPSTAAWVPTFHLKASRQPMLWAALSYSLGIVAGAYLWRPALWWVLAAVAFGAAAAYFAYRRSRLGWALALGLFSSPARFTCKRAQAPFASTPAFKPMRTDANSKSPPTSCATAACSRAASTKSNRPSTWKPKMKQDVQTSAGPTAQAVQSGIRLSIYSPRPTDGAPEEISTTRCDPFRRHARPSLWRPHPRSPPNSSCRAIFAIPAPSTVKAISPTTASPRWAPPKSKMSNASLASPAAGSLPGAAACTAESSPRCINSGLRARPP